MVKYFIREYRPAFFNMVHAMGNAISVIYIITPVLSALVPLLRPHIKGAGKVKSLVNKTTLLSLPLWHEKILSFYEKYFNDFSIIFSQQMRG